MGLLIQGLIVFFALMLALSYIGWILTDRIPALFVAVLERWEIRRLTR